MLASPQYGERWGRHWLDLVRYADTAGETADYPVPVAWRYRNWVIDAFNADKPYDEFLREQIAGDILARRGPRELYAGRVTATGYLAISRRFGFDSENYHHLTIQDTIDTLGQTVLGLTLGCARCHAHKFDPVSMDDYYALYGIFESTRYAFPGSEQKQKSRALVPLVPPEESLPKWRDFDARVAWLGARGPAARDDLTRRACSRRRRQGRCAAGFTTPIAVTTDGKVRSEPVCSRQSRRERVGNQRLSSRPGLRPGWKRGDGLRTRTSTSAWRQVTEAARPSRFEVRGSRRRKLFSPDSISLGAATEWKPSVRSANQWQNLQVTSTPRPESFPGRRPGDVVTSTPAVFAGVDD